MKTVRTAAATALLARAASTAQALPAVQAEFRLSDYSPNPCVDLGSPTLSGLGLLFLGGSLLNRGAPAAPLACSDVGAEASFAIGIGAPMTGERPQGLAAPSPPPAGGKKTWGGPAFSHELAFEFTGQ